MPIDVHRTFKPAPLHDTHVTRHATRYTGPTRYATCVLRVYAAPRYTPVLRAHYAAAESPVCALHCLQSCSWPVAYVCAAKLRASLCQVGVPAARLSMSVLLADHLRRRATRVMFMQRARVALHAIGTLCTLACYRHATGILQAHYRHATGMLQACYARWHAMHATRALALACNARVSTTT